MFAPPNTHFFSRFRPRSRFRRRRVSGVTKAPAGSSGFDAITPDGKKVQVKANFAASQIGFRGDADLLLVLQFNADGTSQEIYYGKHDIVKAQSRFSARDNKHMIAITKLKMMTKLGSVPISDGE